MKKKTRKQFTPADRLHEAAVARYSARFDPELYRRAARRGMKRAIALMDAGAALCGSPYFRLVAGTKWTPDELAFLALFVEEEPTPAATQPDPDSWEALAQHLAPVDEPGEDLREYEGDDWAFASERLAEIQAEPDIFNR